MHIDVDMYVCVYTYVRKNESCYTFKQGYTALLMKKIRTSSDYYFNLYPARTHPQKMCNLSNSYTLHESFSCVTSLHHRSSSFTNVSGTHLNEQRLTYTSYQSHISIYSMSYLTRIHTTYVCLSHIRTSDDFSTSYAHAHAHIHTHTHTHNSSSRAISAPLPLPLPLPLPPSLDTHPLTDLLTHLANTHNPHPSHTPTPLPHSPPMSTHL